jgi:photosystem II stability/assembly factor-like uncharacterized protein
MKRNSRCAFAGAAAIAIATSAGASFADIPDEGRWISHGPYGGAIADLVVHPASGRQLAAHLTNGVYWREAGDQSWTTSDALQVMPILRELVCHPTNPDIVFAATNDGPWASFDGGMNWQARTSDIGTDEVGAIAIIPGPPDVVLAVSWDELYASVDYGASWMETGFTIPEWTRAEQFLVIGTVDPPTVYLAVSERYGAVPDNPGVFKSTDGGMTWSPSGEGLHAKNVFCLAADPANLPYVVAGVRPTYGVDDGGVYVSVDGGAHWTRQSFGIEPEVAIRDIDVARGPDADDVQIEAVGSYVSLHPSAPSSPQVYRFDEHTATWLHDGDGVTHADVPALARASDGTMLIGADRGGVYRMTDAGTWMYDSDRMQPLTVQSIAEDPTNPNRLYAVTHLSMGIYSSEDAGVYRSDDGGRSWTPKSLGLISVGGWMGNDVAVAPTMPPTIFLAHSGWQLFRSVDDAEHWESGYPWNGIDGFWLRHLCVDPEEPLTVYVTGAGFEPSVPDIYKSINGGLWFEWTASDLVWGAFEALTIDPLNAETLYAGTHWEGIWKTTDAAGSWVKTGDEIDGVYCSSLAVDTSMAGRVFAADTGWDSSGLWVTDDGGGSWHPLVSGAAPLNLTCVALQAGTPDVDVPWRLLASTRDDGVFVRREITLPWEPMNRGLNSRDVRTLEYTPSGTLYAGAADGAYRWVILGDLNADGVVDLADLGILLANFGKTEGMTYEDGDIDEDGAVDLSDLGALLAVFGYGT